MEFSLPRAALLDLLMEVMWVPKRRKSAFLGRFQHLQRLKLIEGINPGRGRAAEYQAHHTLVIAIAFQMLQLGLTPERAVAVIRENQERIRQAIGLCLYREGEILPSMFWFDPALLTDSPVEDVKSDWAEATFDYGGGGTGMDAFERFFLDGWVQRMTFISLSGTIWHIVDALEGGGDLQDKPVITEKSAPFLRSLVEWHDNSRAESLA